MIDLFLGFASEHTALEAGESTHVQFADDR